MRVCCFSWGTTCCQIVVVVVIFRLLLFHLQGGLHLPSSSSFFQCWFGFFIHCVDILVFILCFFYMYIYSLVLSMAVAQATNIYGAGTPTAGSLMDQLTNGYQFDKDDICKKKSILLTSSLSLKLHQNISMGHKSRVLDSLWSFNLSCLCISLF